MMVTLIMPICIQCGSMCIIWMTTNNGRKLKVGQIIQDCIILLEILSIIMWYLLMMPVDTVNLASGRSELIRKLCLPLLPAPHHPNPQEDPDKNPSPPPQPPPTPRPPAVPNGHNKPPVTKQPGKEGTEGDHQAPQAADGDDDPRPGKRSKADGPKPGPGRGRLPPFKLDLDQDPLHGDPDPPQGAVGGQGSEPPEGGEESQPPLGEGEGQVEGHPPPLPPAPEPKPHNGDQTHGLLGTVACLLGTWEETFRQLVEDIQEDLDGYWRKLGIPQ